MDNLKPLILFFYLIFIYVVGLIFPLGRKTCGYEIKSAEPLRIDVIVENVVADKALWDWFQHILIFSVLFLDKEWRTFELESWHYGFEIQLQCLCVEWQIADTWIINLYALLGTFLDMMKSYCFLVKDC